MKVAIMQPYLFPYIGYFQLISAVDTFVFYDDVNFMNRGWINRNRILSNGKDLLFTVPLKEASQNKLINEIETDITEKWKSKFYKTMHFSYSKAPYFIDVMARIESVFISGNTNISELSERSVVEICNYIGIQKKFEKSSLKYGTTKGMEKADRLIEITKLSGHNQYINVRAGEELYDKEYYKSKEVDLFFISPKLNQYKQFSNDFIPGLSIIDVLMFNSIPQVIDMLNEYELI
jgi:hypothetical protein